MATIWPWRRLGMCGVLSLGLATVARAQQSTAENVESHCAREARGGGCGLYAVSLIELIASPERWDGKVVTVGGFIHFEFEGNGLYLHREDYEQHLSSNSVWVDVAAGAKVSAQCQDRYVVVEGRFHANDRGHMGGWSGTLGDVTRCVAWGKGV